MEKINLKYALLALLALVVILPISCTATQKVAGTPMMVDLVRSEQNINKNWQYLEENHTTIDGVNQATNWSAIDLPHTWNQWDATDLTPGYRRNASWYKKEMTIPTRENAIYKLYFEGVNTQAEVYVNGQKAGGHIGGYVGFEVDITKFVKRGAANEILVRADNGYNRNIIPSQKADFFIYGGIVRDVFLKILPKQHLTKVLVSTPEVSATRATTQVVAQIENLQNEKAITLQCELLEKATQKMVSQTTKKNITKNTVTLDLPVLRNPLLWSPDAPNLYLLKTKLVQNGQVLDEMTETIGYRWYEFEENGPFLLNGKRLLIRGTHRHEEHAGYGMAVPNEIHRKDMEMIKEMGANFVRLGHYPQDPEVYRAANELGLILWDELPWCRGGVGEAIWTKNTTRLLEEQIQQNYNHPSIFFWSVGNEIYWLPDFPEGGDPEKINQMVSELHQKCHELDPYRLTAIRKYYDGADLVDVFSPSIWSGWYSGVYDNYQTTLEKNRPKYPRFLHMEYGGSSHVGRHTETPITGKGLVNEDEWAETINQANVTNIAKKGDWTENYIVDLFDWYLGITEKLDWFAGNAQWAFKDFGTPLRPENAIPYINQKGLVDRAGNPKDAYYVFKSYWSENPFAYIESHTWTERSGPKDKARNISVFSNAETVELMLNGTSKGKKERKVGTFPASGLNWDLLFQEGKNTLIATAYAQDKVVAADTLVVNYSYQKTGKPHRIALTNEVLPNGNSLIIATMVDKNNQRVLDYENRCYFTLLDGNSELLQHYGTPTRSQVIEMANGRAAIELVPAAGRTVVEARNQDFKGSYMELNFDE
ncbi:MAG: glycoside hydrolase family 2 TIM barrel-domain containing protein [Bacteroidota bacterium]